MEGMIFAAGLGTRLRPLTDTKPKALVEINGKTLLERTIEKFIEHNVCHIVINIHHFAEMMKYHINKLAKKYNCQLIISDESDELLDTGGGLVNAKNLFSLKEDILIHNVDVLSDIDLTDMHTQFANNDCIAMLAVKQRKTSRYLVFNKDNVLSGWTNISTNERIMTRCRYPESMLADINPSPKDSKVTIDGGKTSETSDMEDFDSMQLLAFSGIQIVSPKIFDIVKNRGAFSITKMYLELSAHYPILSYIHEGQWIDCGKKEALDLLENNKQSFKSLL